MSHQTSGADAWHYYIWNVTGHDGTPLGVGSTIYILNKCSMVFSARDRQWTLYGGWYGMVHHP